jgi:flotillin
MGGSGFGLAKQLIESLSTTKDEKPVLETVSDESA